MTAESENRNVVPLGRGHFFAVDRRVWATVCEVGINEAVAYLAQAIEPRLDLVREDLAANIGAMSATPNAALAMRDANNDCDLIYALRRARAYWQAIAASARDPASLQHKGAE